MAEAPQTDIGTSSATALADPPKPPGTPPGAVASGTPEPRRRRTGLIVAIVLSVLAIGLLALSVFIVMASRGGGASAAATKAAYESAMHKAGVKADYPASPIALTSVKPSGSHAFSATFSPQEMAALLNTFLHELNAAGVRISLHNVVLAVPAPGVARLAASVTVNGGTYSGSVTLPLTFSGGRVDSTGVTELSLEGIAGSNGQKAQVASALIAYFNAYLAAAPGLTIESATITADGVNVKGTAPDSLTFP